MKDFKDKVIVITGSATGIGYSLAKQLGLQGAKIILTGRRAHRLREAETKLRELGIEADHKTCDVSDREQVEALADFSWELHGHVDILINNAGIPPKISTTIHAEPEDIERVFCVNLYGTWHGISIFGKRMIAQGTPAGLYAVGSENSLFYGVPGGSVYIASKHALHGMMDALRGEVPDFIHVGLSCPGFVKSEIGENMDMAMETDRYTSIVVEQLKAGAFYIVSHAHNMVHIQKRYDEMANAYATYAPRYDGDEEFDVWSISATAGADILGR